MNRQERIQRGRNAQEAVKALDEAFTAVRGKHMAVLLSPETDELVALEARRFVLALDAMREEMLDYVRIGNDDVKLAEQEQQRG